MPKKLPISERLWRSRRGFLAVLLVLPLSPILIFMMDRAKDIIVDLMEVNSFIEKGQKNNAEQHKGRDCNVSSLVDPLSEDIAKFTEDVPIVKCEGMDWVNCYKSECSIAMEIQKTVKEIVCIYKDVFYLDDRNVYFGNPITVNGNEKYVLNKSDHVKVDCTGKDRTSSLHAHWSGYGFGLRPVPTKSVLDGKDSFNVMILYFGSTSREGFIRKMRKSYQYMTKQLNAVILNSYNIIGNGTTEALYPILTGKSEEELKYHRKRSTKKRYHDSKKFIFHILKEIGYLTAYFEDMSRTDTSQNKFNRFRRQPIDHYLQTSLLTDIGKGENWNRNKNWGQGRPADHCFGAKLHYKLMMDLADEFLQLHGMKFCFTFVEDLAYDNFTVLPTVDETLLSFLRTLSARKALEDTLVLIMGDHGSRFSSIRKTAQSKLEDRLPLMAILLPEQLKTKRPTALTTLKSNKNVLTTPFDIHATILDVLNLKDNKNKHLKAMSLLEPISKSRTCGEASVMPAWCISSH